MNVYFFQSTALHNAAMKINKAGVNLYLRHSRRTPGLERRVLTWIVSADGTPLQIRVLWHGGFVEVDPLTVSNTGGSLGGL